MDERLQILVFEKLQTEDAIDEEWSSLVIAACIGPEDLASALDGTSPAAAAVAAPPIPVEPPGAYLSEVTVQGFRGIGPEASLQLSPGPGLTLVVGRNGSGKSSFAEALELLLTGDNKRWAGRVKVWKEGWRNLHHSDPALVEAELSVEGRGSVRVVHEWKSTDEVDDGETIVQPHGQKKTSLDRIGWRQALLTYRPFLSYNELGSMLDEGPSKLYDALSVVLGLEDLVNAQKMLGEARLARTRAHDAAKAEAKLIRQDASRLNEEKEEARLSRLLTALDAKGWDLDAIDSLLGVGDEGSESEVAILRRLLSLEIPEESVVREAATDLREAAAALADLAGTDAERALSVAGLLEESLTLHQRHGDVDCPVCGTTGALDPTWRERSEQELARLRSQAAAAAEARGRAATATEKARRLVSSVPAALSPLDPLGFDATEVTAAWEAWAAVAQENDLETRAESLEGCYETLAPRLNDLRKLVSEELEGREDVWRPIAKRVAAWSEHAGPALEGIAQVKQIKVAENWLKGAAEEIRNDRFQPIAAQSAAIWERLRQQSNVELGEVKLSGSGTTRRVALDVTVDGEAGAALSVMSQGELNSLALSLFLPRATLAESPFRFVVIDDPVQSMDPSRVDGLARAFEEVAKERQVIVFTHDERLPDAVRHLQIEAKVISVTRRPGSVVELREASHPVKMYIDDAMALANTKELPDEVRRKVIPGFCRHAVEASLTEVIRTRRLSKGDSHSEVEESLRQANKLTSRAALAFFDDPNRGGDVMPRLNQWGGWAGDVFKACNQGAHEKYGGDLFKMVKDTEQLCKKMLSI